MYNNELHKYQSYKHYPNLIQLLLIKGQLWILLIFMEIRVAEWQLILMLL